MHEVSKNKAQRCCTPLTITLLANVIETKFKQFWKELTFSFKMRPKTQFCILRHPTDFYRLHHMLSLTKIPFFFSSDWIQAQTYFWFLKEHMTISANLATKLQLANKWERVWSSGIVQDSGALDCEFEPHSCQCVYVLGQDT